MARTDIARRVYNHTWKLDPIVRSLLDTDFYKLLMLQMIWGLYPKVDATFSLINRTTIGQARRGDRRAASCATQLDHARTLRFSKKEMIWLAGNSFYGRKQIFRAGVPRPGWPNFRLPEYELTKRDGQYELELPRPVDVHDAVGDPGARHHQRAALARRDEGVSARSRSTCSMPAPRPSCGPRPSGCKRYPDIRISDFGTRRRHSFLWQRWCVEALKEGIGDAFTGTSNVLLAMDTDLEALGTNAHELPMVLAALADDRRRS